MYATKGLIAWIDISTFCNAGCPQCHRTDRDGLDKVDWLPLVQWTLEEFKARFTPDDMEKISKFEICGTWGDPVMNKDLLEICKYIMDNSWAWVQINTNGSIRDEDWWWELGVTLRDRGEIYFQLEGTDQETHSKYRQKTDLEKIKSNIIAYAATGSIAHCHTIVFEHNEDQLYDIALMAKELGMNGEMIFQLSNRFHNNDEDTFTDEDGKEVTLRPAKNRQHPLLHHGVAPLRDKDWWEKIGKHKLSWGLWTPKSNEK